MGAKRILFLIPALVSILTPVQAQTITGSITGTVTDPTASVVPNATVTAVNTGTNIANTAQTNDAGIYNIRFLPIGEYRVEVTSQGFRKTVLGPFRVEVGQVARLDVSLEVGEVTQAVEITGIAPILQTETTQTGETISSNTATSLPLQGRNFSSLTLLVPGSVTAAPDEFNSAARQNGRPFVNGNREQTNNFLLDGADINEHMDNGIGYAPNVDAIAEVRVITGNASAEYGNANGAIVNMTMKSGTNAIHGNLFEFLRNEKFDANDFFLNRNGQDKRALRRNIFGGTLGGPIVRNRLFFFVDYQGTRERTSGPVLASVAPAAFRTGDLSRITRGIRDPLRIGACVNRNDPGCFPGNIIPPSRITNPAARALFSSPELYPLPNQTGSGALGLTNNYVGQGRTVVDNDQADAKVDWRLSDNDQVSSRFSIARYRATNGATVALPTQLGTEAVNPTTGGVITWTRTISPSIVNEARAAFTQVGVTSNTIDIMGQLGPNGNETLGISGGQPIAGASAIVLGEGITNVGSNATDSSTVDNTFQYGDNLTMQAGRHLLKMGGQALRYQQNRYYAGNNGLLGTFSFSGNYTGSPFSDFLLDQLQQKGRGSQTGRWGHRQWRTAVFFQDDFKVATNLTLNLGLRWEYSQPVYEVADRQVNVDLQTGEALFAGQNGNSRALYNPYWKQFMPRVGFAWTPAMFGNRVVVRGAYGITSYLEGTGGNLRLPLNPPFFFESDIRYDNTVPGSIQSGFSDVMPLNTLSGQVRHWNPNLRPAFIQQYNFSLEYQVSSTFSLNTAYVGQKGTHLVVATEYNQPVPDPGPVSTWRPLQERRPLYGVAPLITNIAGTDSSSNMNYNSLQVSGRKRLSGGLEFITSYTFSKTLTDNRGFYGKGGYVNSEGAYFQNAYDRQSEYGRAFFDATHNFTLGGTYELPFGRNRAWGRDWNRFADAVLGGWTLNFVSSLRSGFPVTMVVNDQSNQAVRGATRPNRYKEGFENYAQSVDNWFGFSTADLCLTPGVNDGTCVYGVPAPGTFGNSSKATENAPGFRNLDLSIGKRFRITEENYFDFRAEFFNALNHPNFGPPNNNISVPGSLGIITRQVGSPRNIQFGLKYYF
jgi:Carboxypeptidase regulatory-like domain/TonB-dependent Receptor Plug Domain/TonB dependent receptor